MIHISLVKLAWESIPLFGISGFCRSWPMTRLWLNRHFLLRRSFWSRWLCRSPSKTHASFTPKRECWLTTSLKATERYLRICMMQAAVRWFGNQYPCLPRQLSLNVRHQRRLWPCCRGIVRPRKCRCLLSWVWWWALRGFEPLKTVPDDKKVVLGLITTKSPVLEDKAQVIARIHGAAEYLPIDRLYLSPQCGFASWELATSAQNRSSGTK